MTKALKKAFETASGLPDKEQDALAGIVLTVVERSRGASRIDLAEFARRARDEAARNGMTQEIFDELTTHG